jgi:hypothetical protein
LKFFPVLCLSADCGAWAVKSTVAFIEDFHRRLGVQGRFAAIAESVRV